MRSFSNISSAVQTPDRPDKPDSIVNLQIIVWLGLGWALFSGLYVGDDGVMEAGYYCHYTSVSLHTTLRSGHLLTSYHPTRPTKTYPDTPITNYISAPQSTKFSSSLASLV